MAKKRDILSNYFTNFTTFKSSYKTRLDELKRDFINEKNVYKDLLDKVDEEYKNDQDYLSTKYVNEEDLHKKRKDLIVQDYNERVSFLNHEIDLNNVEYQRLIEEENRLYQDVLNQFEERKQEALTKYLELIHESEKKIDESVDVHHDFIESETKKTKNLKEYYQDINNLLSDDLLNTMEKAKNALDTLNDSLKDSNINDYQELNQTILKSLESLRDTQISIISLFKENSSDLEKHRDSIKKISRNKQQPHSELNQEMIKKYVKQIREINNSKIIFEAKVKNDLELSLTKIYKMIMKAHDEKDDDSLKKYIYQKEIIEKKAEYLLHRNSTLSKFSISKYQQEIKKIKIDSFKRSEEIKLAYSVPITFLQNSIDTYSNFAFYLNQGFDELDRLLNNLIDFHQEFFDIKTNFITTTSKVYEDYKINMLVRINDVTNNLTKLISKIDEVSLQIITLESNNRLEIAEIRKKIENVEIFGDYQKYLASLENDKFFAVFQHSKNIESIQVKYNYKNSLLNINNDVLNLNKNKELSGEHLEYMLNLSKMEETIHQLSFDKMISQYDVFYKQQNQIAYLMQKMAKLEVVNQIKCKNYQYSSKFMNIRNTELEKDEIGSNSVVDFIHHMQKLINNNNNTTAALKQYLSNSNYDMSYLTIIEKNRYILHQELNQQLEKKIHTCYRAASLYHRESNDIINDTYNLIYNYTKKFKELLVYNESNYFNNKAKIIQSRGYFNEISSLVTYIYKKATNQAFKYQIPDEVDNLKLLYDKTLTDFNQLVVSIFDKFKTRTRTRVFYIKLQSYIINSLIILNAFKNQTIKSLTNIRDKISENDLLIIANAKIQIADNKKIIDKEYDNLAYQAIQTKNKRKKQIKLLLDNSDTLNDNFKNRVKKINNAYLQEKEKTNSFLRYLEKEIKSIIKNNDDQLLKMLKMIDKEIFDERISFDTQYKKYISTINLIRANMKESYKDEVKYLYDLNYKREEEISKTISLLEEEISMLPNQKETIMQEIETQKSQLFIEKQQELVRKYSDIEGQKLLSKPLLMKEIERVEKRLPEDYAKLYNNIHELENELLQQYMLTNERYYENYKDYVNKQFSNRILIDKESGINKSFEWLNSYHNDLLSIFKLNYKETLQKSADSRKLIKDQKQKSKEKQDRIINA